MTRRILGIAGSLRRDSSNRKMLLAAGRLVPSDVTLEMWEGLGDLPHLNPELDTDTPPAPVREFRTLVRAVDAILICSPEYAFGVPGVMKNALDWLVGGGDDVVGKPVASINVSPRATLAQASLLRTLEGISARVVHEACVTIPLVGKQHDVDAMVADETIASPLREVVERLRAAMTLRS